MKYPRLVSAVRSAKWAILPTTLDSIVTTLGAAVRGDLNPKAGWMDGEDDEPRPEMTRIGSIAVIPIYGIIGKRLSSMAIDCGGCDIDAVSEWLDQAVADPRVEVIVLDIDSPGGAVTGVPEVAARVKAAGEKKLTVAFTETQACSAAYWIGSQCHRFIMAESADVGSIGVYIALMDVSGNWAQEGYKLELIKAGKYKAAGISGSSLSDEQRALLQADVDTIYSQFTGAVKAARPGVTDETCQGQTFMGSAALTAGLVDEIDPDFLRNLSSFGMTG